MTSHGSKRFTPRKLVIVGPKPPPIGGSPLTVQAMTEELSLYPGVRLKLINSSPVADVREKMTGFKVEKIRRTFGILPEYLREIQACDAVVVFANDLFAATLAPLLLLVARLYSKPFFLKPVGAGIDLFIQAQQKIVQKYMLTFLRAATGILAQTRLLQQDLRRLGIRNIHYLPGCRPIPPIFPVKKCHAFRIIYLGHITRRKGPLVLIDALRGIQENCPRRVECDFFGPIHDDVRSDFLRELPSVPSAKHCGLAEPGTGAQIIARYNALVLPTYYDTEGHPGVIIEAMHAGVPVITTNVRTLSELVTDGVNGFLVPQKDSFALAEAIRRLAEDPHLSEKMGEANRARGKEFLADTVVAQMLGIVFPQTDLVELRLQRN